MIWKIKYTIKLYVSSTVSPPKITTRPSSLILFNCTLWNSRFYSWSNFFFSSLLSSFTHDMIPVTVYDIWYWVTLNWKLIILGPCSNYIHVLFRIQNVLNISNFLNVSVNFSKFYLKILCVFNLTSKIDNIMLQEDLQWQKWFNFSLSILCNNLNHLKYLFAPYHLKNILRQ